MAGNYDERGIADAIAAIRWRFCNGMRKSFRDTKLLKLYSELHAKTRYPKCWMTAKSAGRDV